MRILHAVLSSGFYGSERYCIDLAIAQAGAGHDVVVIGQDRRSDCGKQFRSAVARATRDGPLAGSVRTLFLPRILPPWLQRPAAQIMLRRFRPAIVHTHLNPAARRIGQVAERLGIAHVVTLLIHYEKREHGSCAGLIAVNETQRRTIPETFRGEIAVIWLWLSAVVRDAIAHVTDAQVEALRRQWGAGTADIVFGGVGRLTSVKGMDTLIRAFKTEFAANEPVRLVLVGDGEDRGMLEGLRGGDRRIVFAGHQADVVPFYRAFDVFVSASRFEPFGLAIVEAMAAGCRLVVTRTDGPSEFLKDPTARWAAPDCVDELAAQLRLAGGSGRERAQHDMAPLEVSRLAADIEAFYRRVLQEKVARDRAQSTAQATVEA